MTWAPIQPFATAKGTSSARSAVMLSSTRPDGRFRHALWIVIRPKLWQGGAPKWLVHGGKVSVQLGSGADAGQLRLVPGGAFSLDKMIGTDKEALRLRIPPLPAQLKTKQRPEACEFDWHDDDDWVAITLPAWCRPRPAVPQPALSPNADRAARAA